MDAIRGRISSGVALRRRTRRVERAGEDAGQRARGDPGRPHSLWRVGARVVADYRRDWFSALVPAVARARRPGRDALRLLVGHGVRARRSRVDVHGVSRVGAGVHLAVVGPGVSHDAVAARARGDCARRAGHSADEAGGWRGDVSSRVDVVDRRGGGGLPHGLQGRGRWRHRARAGVHRSRVDLDSPARGDRRS